MIRKLVEAVKGSQLMFDRIFEAQHKLHMKAASIAQQRQQAQAELTKCEKVYLAKQADNSSTLDYANAMLQFINATNRYLEADIAFHELQVEMINAQPVERVRDSRRQFPGDKTHG